MLFLLKVLWYYKVLNNLWQRVKILSNTKDVYDKAVIRKSTGSLFLYT